jgi:hypothetical protein
MRRIEQTEGGIDLIAARLATADDWRKPYLNDMGPLPASALDARVTMLRRLHANRVPLDRQESLPIQSQLIGRLRIDLARQVWQLTEQHSATRGTPVVVNDPDLLGVVTHGDRSPFEWTFPGSAGVYIDTAMAPAPLGRKVAHLRANSPIRIAFAEQMIALPPGAHMLTASITGAKTQSPLALELECWPQKTLVEGGTGELAQGTVHLSARVPQDCTYQKLRLLISGPEARNQADLFIGGVTFGS